MDDGSIPGNGSQHFIGNRWVGGASGESLDVTDPSEGQPFARIARGNAADIDAAVRAAQCAWDNGSGDWGRLSAFGLVAGVWTRDDARQIRLTRQLRCDTAERPHAFNDVRTEPIREIAGWIDS